MFWRVGLSENLSTVKSELERRESSGTVTLNFANGVSMSTCGCSLIIIFLNNATGIPLSNCVEFPQLNLHNSFN